VLAFIAPAGIAAERFHKLLQQALLLLEPRRERAHGFFVARAPLLLGSDAFISIARAAIVRVPGRLIPDTLAVTLGNIAITVAVAIDGARGTDAISVMVIASRTSKNG